MRTFDRKFGKELFRSIPAQPGVYRYFDAEGRLIYVGKAKNLRRRLAQYRNSKRRKAHHRMREILRLAASLEFETCGSELEATLLEAKLIRELRPALNLTGAFSFMYPYLGVRKDLTGTYLCFTTEPKCASGYSLHGCFRSRGMTLRAYEALTELLKGVAQPFPARRLGRYGKAHRFRGLPSFWVDKLEEFLLGQSREAMEELVLALIESTKARARPRRTQLLLNDLRWFWRHEILPLSQAVRSERCSYPIEQDERDELMIRARHRRSERAASRMATLVSVSTAG